jgi:hypothetical protein
MTDIMANRPSALKTRPSLVAQLLQQVVAAEAAGQHDVAIEMLRRNKHSSIEAWARAIVDSRIHWICSAAPTDYDRSRYEDSPGLLEAGRKLYLFVETDEHPSPLHHDRQKAFKIFTDTLSSMAFPDAELLRLASHKQLPEGVTAELLIEAYPSLTEAQPRNRAQTASHDAGIALQQAAREFATVRGECEAEISRLMHRVHDNEARIAVAREQLHRAEERAGLFPQGGLR